jgi:putative nucleotidyltransferase with HDIG domain
MNGAVQAERGCGFIMKRNEEKFWKRFSDIYGRIVNPRRGIIPPPKIYHDMIVGVIAALEAKDHPTASHSLRVSDMTEQICRILGLPSVQTELIHMAAHVHDIGKIGVPDHILTKPGRLTAEEWDCVKQHPRIGAEILKKFDGLSEVAEIILHHHERWDGKGYPDGLKGEGIPLGSRIIAVCDSIDAMMSCRPYRKICSPAECMDEIKLNSGIMFDPAVVRVLLQNWDAVVTNILFNRFENDTIMR